MDASTLPDLSTPALDLARTDYVRLFEDETSMEALSRLRRENLGERILYFYVTDSDGKLSGVVPTRRLLLAPPDAEIREIMTGPVASAPDSATLGEALERMTSHRFMALPIIDSEGRLKSVIDLGTYAQQAIDLERRESSDELFQLVGVHIERERRIGILGSVRGRFPWLLLNIASGFIAALITGLFGDVLSAHVEVAFFIPIVLALAESVAMQSATIALSQLPFAGLGEEWSLRSVLREFRIGGLLGITAGLAAGALCLVWLRQPDVAGLLCIGILAGTAAGATLGISVPFLVRRWKLDPRIASGPASLALADMWSLTAYLTVSLVLLQ